MEVMLVSSNEFLITWEDQGEPIKLYRSEFPEEGWEFPLFEGEATSFTDCPPGPPSAFTKWHYKVVADSGTVLGPTRLQVAPDRVAYQSARYATRHIERIGQDAFLFSRRTKGNRCDSCWDSLLDRRIRSECSACQNTGYVEGAPEAVAMKMSFGLEEPTPEPTANSKMVQMRTQAWTAGLPLLKIGDFIVRAYDRRVYEVLQWQPTRRMAYLLRQNVMLKLVEQGSSASALADLIPSD